MASETEDSVQIKVKEITGEQGVKGFYWNIGAESYVTATEGAQSICQHNPTFCQTYIVEQYNADPTRSDLRTIKFYIDSSKTQLWASRTANLVSCGTNKVMPTCQPDYVPGSNEVIKTVSVQDAINSISDTEMQTDLSPEVISDVVNNAWQKAASEAGYSGFAYDHTRPVTARDVTASTGAAKPAVSDFLKPSDKPDLHYLLTQQGQHQPIHRQENRLILVMILVLGRLNWKIYLQVLKFYLHYYHSTPLKIQPVHLMQKAKELNMRSVQNLYWRFLTDNIS
ncbi:hypothetical protein GUU82_11730 [Escherichia coli]|uniref:hypothetical protein n=1 Tax=Escherichia coli TaxID=562 RepID=UPI0013628C7F|nr:hypothetical protein [Escherichia coli]QHJ56884.1 hypothetical protein GUU82_11730 [Escherichia coli]